MSGTSSEGRIVKAQTTSDTVQIAAGRIVCMSVGLVIATTLPSVDVPVFGVSASKVASRDTASSEDINIQISAVASVPKTTTATIYQGQMCYCQATTTTVGTGSGSTCLMAAGATTLSAGYAYLGRAAYEATTSDAEVKIALNPTG